MHSGVVVGGPDINGRYDVATVFHTLLKAAFPKQAAANKFHPSFEGNVNTGTPLKVAPGKNKEPAGQLSHEWLQTLQKEMGHGGRQGVKRKASSMAMRPAILSSSDILQPILLGARETTRRRSQIHLNTFGDEGTTPESFESGTGSYFVNQ